MGLNAEYVEKVSGDHPYPDHLAAVFANQASSLYELAGEAGKNCVPVAQREIGGMREGVQAVAAVRAEATALNPELDEFSRVTNWEQSQHDLIEEREDRRICANPERERKNGGESEPRVRPELPNSILQVLPDRVDGIHSFVRGGKVKTRREAGTLREI
jgi:hypothetical protein